MEANRKDSMKRSLVRIYFRIRKFFFSGSNNFWINNYAKGGTSGPGSYGDLALFKANFLNQFVRENYISNVLEFGCGDGNQVSYFDFPNYIGVDISAEAVAICKAKNKRPNYEYYEYDPSAPLSRSHADGCELSLSLDVIYHLVERNVYLRHLELLFESSQKFVIIYGRDSNEFFPADFTHPREFTADILRLYPEWKLVRHVKNELSSWSDFYVYLRNV